MLLFKNTCFLCLFEETLMGQFWNFFHRICVLCVLDVCFTETLCLVWSNLNIATGETSQVITSRHFSSLLFTSMSILTSLALINWKANTIHIHISNNSTFPFISLHFILSLLLSIERQKQYKYINKAIQKAQLSSYILVTHTEIFLDTLKPRLYKKFYQIL